MNCSLLPATHFSMQTLFTLAFLAAACPALLAQHSMATQSPKLDTLTQDIRDGKLGKIDALVIYQEGKERYKNVFQNKDLNALHPMQSVTKSVTGLLTAIALSEGAIKSTNDPIADYLPQYKEVMDGNPRMRDIQIKHILNMQFGMKWEEDPYETSILGKMNHYPGDWAEFFLKLPVDYHPADSFIYNSGAVVLLSRILWNATGQRPDEYARDKLFKPLGIRDFQWHRSDFDQLPHTGGGLALRIEDLVKIGTMVLNNGYYNGQQVISKEWISQLKGRSNETWFGSLQTVYYNNLWWLFPENIADPKGNRDGDIITCSGFGGQWLFVIPKYKAVVAFTGSSNGGPDYSLRVLYRYILPVLKLDYK